MKTRKKPSKGLMFLASICLLALLSLSGYFLFRSHQNSATKSPATVNSVNYATPTVAQKQEGERIKEQNAQPPPTNTQTPGGQLTVTISRLSQSSIGSPVSLRTIVQGTSSGQCIVTFTLSGEIAVSRITQVVSAGNYYTCGSIDVPSSEFGSDGNWRGEVYVRSSGSTTSNTAAVTVVVKK